jgi:hypothetical protein
MARDSVVSRGADMLLWLASLHVVIFGQRIPLASL